MVACPDVIPFFKYSKAWDLAPRPQVLIVVIHEPTPTPIVQATLKVIGEGRQPIYAQEILPFIHEQNFCLRFSSRLSREEKGFTSIPRSGSIFLICSASMGIFDDDTNTPALCPFASSALHHQESLPVPASSQI